MTGTIWGLVAFLSLVFGAIWAAVRAVARKEDLQNEVEASRASVEAEQKRVRLDDDISQDADLAARARRAGLVRADKP